MEDIFLLCYATLKAAGAALDQLVKFFEDNPNQHITSIELADAILDVPYPYWVGVVFDTSDLDSVDNWMCKNYVSAPDFYSGQARYLEFRAHSTSIQVIKCDRGEISR